LGLRAPSEVEKNILVLFVEDVVPDYLQIRFTVQIVELVLTKLKAKIIHIRT